MSGFCVLLVSVWLFDSDLRRWIFPALLGSGQAGTKCTPLWETSPRHFPSHLSSPAAPVLNGRAGLSPPPPLPPGPRLPPRLRGCARLRHRLRREGSQPLSAGARDVPGFSSFAGGFNPRLFPSRCSLPRYALGAAGSRSPPGAAGGLTPPPALTRPPGPPRWDGADGTVPLRLPPRWGRSLFPRPQPAGTCLAPGWGRCSWRRGGHDVDVPARRASEMQLGRRGWALLVSAWKQSGVFPG